MIEFKPITIADKELITSYILPGERQDSSLSFATLCSWHFYTCSSYAIVDDSLVIRFCMDGKRSIYTLPMEKQHFTAVMDRLEKQARESGEEFCLYGVFPEMQQLLDEYFPDVFIYELNRDSFDYIYHRADLADLSGKYYQPKRNHVNKFKKMYEDYHYTPLTPDLVPYCLDLHKAWCLEHKCSENESLKNEWQALTFALEHFKELDLLGGALWVKDEIVAFTYGAPINHNTFGVHAEKANVAVEGAYSMINHLFARYVPSQYVYLNREEDLGLPGLRKAKLSYHPAILLEKGFAYSRRVCQGK